MAAITQREFEYSKKVKEFKDGEVEVLPITPSFVKRVMFAHYELQEALRDERIKHNTKEEPSYFALAVAESFIKELVDHIGNKCY